MIKVEKIDIEAVIDALESAQDDINESCIPDPLGVDAPTAVEFAIVSLKNWLNNGKPV
jgi:hypothetical protein